MSLGGHSGEGASRFDEDRGEPVVSCDMDGHTGAAAGYDYCNGPAGLSNGTTSAVMLIRGPGLHGLVVVNCVVRSPEPDTCYLHSLWM